MQKLLLISGDSAPFYRLVAEALCDRFDKMLLIEVADFKKFIYSGLQPDNQTEKITTQQHNIGIAGATATAAEERGASERSTARTESTAGAMAAPPPPACK